MEVHRGEVFYADLSPVVGSEQGGIRPVLIIQNEIGNRHSPTVIAAAITSRQDKNRLPTHISVRADRCGLAKDSIILTEQIRTLDKRRLRERAGVIPPTICAASMRRWGSLWGWKARMCIRIRDTFEQLLCRGRARPARSLANAPFKDGFAGRGLAPPRGVGDAEPYRCRPFTAKNSPPQVPKSRS